MSFDLEKRALEEFEYVVGSVDIWRERAIQLAREAADARAEKIAKACEARINDPAQGGHAERLACAAVLRSIARIARSTISKPAEPAPAMCAMYDVVEDDAGKLWRIDPGVAWPSTVAHRVERAPCSAKYWGLPRMFDEPLSPLVAVDEAEIRADERARLIAEKEMVHFGWAASTLRQAVDVLNSTRDLPKPVESLRAWLEDALWGILGQPKPQTREQRLEDALEEIISRFSKPTEPVESSFALYDCLRLAKRALEWKP